MTTFQAQSLSVCAAMLVAFAATSAVSAGAALRTPGATPQPARSMVIPVCEPNCIGAPSSTESNSRPEDDYIPYAGPQTDGAPNSTYDNTSPPDASDFAGSPSSTFENLVPQDASPPAGEDANNPFADPAPAQAIEAAPFDPYEALKSATPR